MCEIGMWYDSINCLPAKRYSLESGMLVYVVAFLHSVRYKGYKTISNGCCNLANVGPRGLT